MTETNLEIITRCEKLDAELLPKINVIMKKMEACDHCVSYSVIYECIYRDCWDGSYYNSSEFVNDVITDEDISIISDFAYNDVEYQRAGGLDQ